MKDILNRLIQHQTISREEARTVLIRISEGAYNPSQVAAFLTVYMMRAVTVQELSGFREALLELCLPVQLDAPGAIDLCGTGGDGKDTFNISTLASFVTAAAGVPVVKHGNYGVSSRCGSSNVLEALGIRFSNENDYLKRCLHETGIAILHAPLFHPAMKQVAPIRKELAVKTFFNMLGPMVNPARPANQMVGVFNLELARLYTYLYQDTDTNYSIIHALDGYDEITLTDTAKMITRDGEALVRAANFGTEKVIAQQITGGDSIEDAARIFATILQGKGSEAQNNVVCANTAVALTTAQGGNLEANFNRAKELLCGGKALDTFRRLQELSKVYA